MLGCLAFGAASTGGACSSDEQRDECFGGILVNGVCEGKCKPDLCLEGNTCVDNRCVLKCSSHLECFAGTQDCTPAIEDDTKQEISVCKPNEKPLGYGAACPFGFECAQYGTCPDGTTCNPVQCNNNPGDCQPDPEVCGDNPACSAGKCSDGTACFVSTCSAAECTPLGLTCVGKGEGDADAYCAKPHCETDADCPGGYECTITRDPHAICGTDPQKGNNDRCGTTTEECIDRATFGDGNTFQEGPTCLLRKTCLKRAQCAPCSSDLDCSLISGQRCVTIGGESRCARTCGTDSDCDIDYKCEAGACTPRFGACVGQGNFCEPCRNDTDCGGPDTTVECISTSLRGQRACFDVALPIQCSASTADSCPKSPSGLPGACLCLTGQDLAACPDGQARCYLPSRRLDPRDPSSTVFTCW